MFGIAATYNSQTSESPDLTLLVGENLVSEVPVYLDEAGNRYSERITINFKRKVARRDIGDAKTSDLSLLDPHIHDIRSALDEIDTTYKIISFEKVFPNAQWGNNFRKHRRTGETVEISERSQVFYLHFNKPVRIDPVSERLSQFPGVKFAEGPGIAYLTSEAPPDDPFCCGNGINNYESLRKWAVDTTRISKAWHLVRIDHSAGDTMIIAISDYFSEYDANSNYHNDLKPASSGGNIVDIQSGAYPLLPFDTEGAHGPQVTSVAGATTNNSINMAGAAWNPGIMTVKIFAPVINYAIENGADIINMSYISCEPIQLFEQSLVDALLEGVLNYYGLLHMISARLIVWISTIIWGTAGLLP